MDERATRALLTSAALFLAMWFLWWATKPAERGD